MTENTNTNKFTSRKFIVWIVSTLIMIACCVMGFITKETNVVTSFTGTKTTGRKQSDYKEPIRNIEDRSCITSRKREGVLVLLRHCPNYFFYIGNGNIY